MGRAMERAIDVARVSGIASLWVLWQWFCNDVALLDAFYVVGIWL